MDANPVEISWDGKTVWVNGLDGLLGRFSKRRMDVHAEGRCERCGPGTWQEFTAAMWEMYHVVVPTEAEPVGEKCPTSVIDATSTPAPLTS